MDARKYMVVDLQRRGEKKMFLTERVESMKQEAGRYTVMFVGQPRPYTYSRERLLFLQNPEKVDLEGRGLYVRKKHITDATEVYRFGEGDHTFWHIVYENGYYSNEDGRNVYLSRTPINMVNADLWDYLNHVVKETGIELKPSGTDETLNLLQLQYNLVDTNRDNVPLANFLGLKTQIKARHLPNTVIYPFGCNGSQKQAVENALTHQFSIIQGPPGTGKTQTILNIIANLLVKGKTVMVVSNNNSAVDNVAEKLSSDKVGLGFLVAKLGSVENRNHFIENQPTRPIIAGWKLENEYAVIKEISEALRLVSENFEKQTQLSRLHTEQTSLETEAKYNTSTLNEDKAQSWLDTKPSTKLLSLSAQLQSLLDEDEKLTLFSRLKWTWALGLKTWDLLKKPQTAIDPIEASYYAARRREIRKEIFTIESFLRDNDIAKNMDALRSQSLQYLKSAIADHYKGKNRKIFERKTIKKESEEFLKEYPIVLSTTYSAKSCISKDMVFDYVIMDEASQVDIATGALALSCAENAVIVGDDKQLPNVIDGKTLQVLTDIEEAHQVEDKYRITTHSFLKSCIEVFSDAPITLLREHYRCQPKIIEFCNKMFYDGELLTMTADDSDPKTLSVIRTVKGNHARGHVNQREIDVIVNEVMPHMSDGESVGIISPYRDQTIAINQQLHCDIASTVHKYQGRECDTIILSMVDNAPTSFSDDANLLNVAISRAKSRLCIVATGNDLPTDSILAQLIGYVQYNNFDVTTSQLHSVFDILYGQYTQQRLEYERHRGGNDLGELSENIIYNTLVKALEDGGMKNIGILAHYPLSRLLPEAHTLTQQQQDFVNSPLSHVDFLLYNTVTKRPMMCIEVDGRKFHNTDVQKHRDQMKDEILGANGLKPVRLSTMSTVTVESVKKIITGILSPNKYVKS